MLKRIIGLGTLAALIPFSTQAAGVIQTSPNYFNYNYAEVDYVDVKDFDGGLRLQGSYDVLPNLAVFGSYLAASAHGADYSLLYAGATYHRQWTQIKNTDMLFHGAITRANVDFKNGNESDTGVTVGAGLRHEPQAGLELFADASLTGVIDNDLRITGGAALNLTKEISITASYTIADNDVLAIGGRYYFK